MCLRSYTSFVIIASHVGVCLSLQEDMLQNRREEFENSIVELTSWDGFVKALDDKKMVRTPWCDNTHVFSPV